MRRRCPRKVRSVGVIAKDTVGSNVDDSTLAFILERPRALSGRCFPRCVTLAEAPNEAARRYTATDHTTLGTGPRRAMEERRRVHRAVLTELCRRRNALCGSR